MREREPKHESSDGIVLISHVCLNSCASSHLCRTSSTCSPNDSNTVVAHLFQSENKNGYHSQSARNPPYFEIFSSISLFLSLSTSFWLVFYLFNFSLRLYFGGSIQWWQNFPHMKLHHRLFMHKYNKRMRSCTSNHNTLPFQYQFIALWWHFLCQCVCVGNFRFSRVYIQFTQQQQIKLWNTLYSLSFWPSISLYKLQ